MVRREVAGFALLLQRYRVSAGLTQEELAERAGLSARGISDLERGERTRPRPHTVHRLAQALGLSSHDRSIFEEAARTGGGESPGADAVPVGSYLGARPAGRLIGRQAELEAILTLARTVAAGSGRLLLIEGEPGVGKTRLAQEVGLHLAQAGFGVASGRCYEPEQLVPYYPFLEALTTLLQAAPQTVRAEVAGRWPALGWLLPELVAAPKLSSGWGQDAQQLLFRAVTGLLQALAQVAPLALLLDDLHWADESSLKLLQYVARMARGSRLLLLGIYRDVEVGRQHPLERLRHDLLREELLDELAVGRLEQAETATLAAALLSEAEVSQEVVQLVYERTSGNPFFVQEVIRALVERGDVVLGDGSWNRRAVEEMEVPRSVHAAISERVLRLSDGAQGVLHQASVLGQVFGFDDLRRMTKRAEEGVEGALEEALAAKLVRANGEDAYAFDHALTHQTLYEDLPPHRRRRLHAAAAAALEALPEPAKRGRAPELAHHFQQAHDPAPAIRWLEIAGDNAAATFAHAEAERQYRTALALAQDIRNQAREAEALLKLGSVLRLAGRYDDALELLERAAEICRTAGDLEGEARATQVIGNVHHARGTPHAGYTRVRTVVERLERLPESSRPTLALAELYVVMGLDLYPTGRYTEAVAASERAALLIDAAHDERSRAVSALPRGHALTMMGRALTMMGRWSEARKVLEEALPVFEAIGNPWRLAHPVGNLARTYVHQGDLATGRRYWERALQLNEAAHDPSEVAWASCYLGDVSFVVGDWLDARRQYERAADLARSVGSARYLSHALLHLADLCALQGKGEEALRYREEAIALAVQVGDAPALRTAQRLVAERDLAEGRAEAALVRLHPLLDELEGEEPHAFPPPVLAEAYAAIGEMDRAHELVERRVQRFKDQDHKRALALWLRVQGSVLGHQRHWEEADRVFAEAVSLAHAMPYPYAEGRALYEWGVMEQVRGEEEASCQHLQAALTIFERVGARPYAERTRQRLTGTNVVPSKATQF